MARIKISLPDSFSFTATIPVRITDINYGGHVGNDSILSILHEARVRLLEHFGYTEKRIADNVGLIMGSVAIEFKRESFYGDVLEISIAASGFERVSFELLYKLVAKRAAGDVHIASAQTTMVCYNYHTGKVASVPEDLKRSINN